MARDRYDYDEEDEEVQRAPKKADVILKRQQELAAKQQEVLEQTAQTNAMLDRILQAMSATPSNPENEDEDGNGNAEIAFFADRNEEFYETLEEESSALKRDLKFLAAQNESIFDSLTEKIKKLSEQLEQLNAGKPEQPAQEEAQQESVQEQPVQEQLDYELLADKVAERIPAPQVVTRSEGVQTVVAQAEIDYDLLAEKVAARIPATEVLDPVQVSAEIDYDLLAEKVAGRIPAPRAVTQGEGVRTVVSQTEIDYDLLADKVAERIPAPAATAASGEIDLDALAEKVAERIQLPAPQAIVAAAPVETVQAEVDAEELANKILARMPLQEAVSPDYIASKVAEQIIVPAAQTAEIDYETLANKVAELMPAPQQAVAYSEAAPASVQLDEEELANKICEKLGTQSNDILLDEDGCTTISEKIAEGLDYDAIARKVAELMPVPRVVSDGETVQTVIRESAEIDYDLIASKVAEQIVLPEVAATAAVSEIDEDAIAEKAAAVLSNYLPEFDTDEVAEKVATQVINALPAAEAAQIDSRAISDAVAEKLMRQQSENDYDIVIDEDGLNRIAETVAERLAVGGEEEPDYEEMAHLISENITVAGVDEDAIAQKAAAVLSEYVYDTDEIAGKVAEKVIEALPEVNNEELAQTVADKVIEAFPEEEYDEEEDEEFNIVIDEDGINEVTERVAKGTEERFDTIDREIAEIKKMLFSGVCVVRENSDEIAGAQACEEVYEEQTEEPEEEEALVTVSDIIADEETEEVVEEQPEEELVEEEVTEEPVEEPAEEETTEELVEEQPAEEEIIEEPAEEPEEEVEEAGETEEEELIEEFTYEDLVNVAEAAANEDGEDSDEEGEEGEGGVDFANMMRYNRSFIARIIQGTDEQKTYYGEVRNALLSYKKVNSNIAWGAERFHKGRETIARFKIRGKTLVVYLALDPATHEYSVYHHKDVSDNKSVAGTPMMIKVKSPLGVKKAVRLIDEMLQARNGEKRNVPQRDYAAMYPYETIEELIEDGLVKDVKKDK